MLDISAGGNTSIKVLFLTHAQRTALCAALSHVDILINVFFHAYKLACLLMFTETNQLSRLTVLIP